MDLNKLGGRKFILATGVSLVASLFLLIGKLSEDTWKTVIMATAAIYVSGNVGQKYALRQTPAQTN